MKKAILFSIIVLLSLAVNIYAQVEEAVMGANTFGNLNPYRENVMKLDYPAKPSLNFEQSINGAGELDENTPTNKMGVGLINALTAWTDIPKQVKDNSEGGNIIKGMTIGLGQGLISSVARGASGAIDTATFGMPPYNRPMTEPEYKVEDTRKDMKINLLTW